MWKKHICEENFMQRDVIFRPLDNHVNHAELVLEWCEEIYYCPYCGLDVDYFTTDPIQELAEETASDPIAPSNADCANRL